MDGLIRALMWPLRQFERSEGPARLAFSLVAFLLMLVSALGIRRAASLNGLPDIAEPAAVRALRTEPPAAESDNAFVLYDRAARLLENVDLAGLVHPDMFEPAYDASYLPIAEKESEAFAAWREGTQHPNASLRDDGRSLAALSVLARAALSRGMDLQSRGDLDGAWDLYHDALRCSRHVAQAGGIAMRRMAIELHDAACRRIASWGDQRSLTVDSLHRAIAVLDRLEGNTPPATRTLARQYLLTLDELRTNPLRAPGRDSSGKVATTAGRDLLQNEPERSRRVLRLIYANWLAEAARPRTRPPTLVSEYPTLFTDPSFPPSARALKPDTLREWLTASDLSRLDDTWVEGLDRELFEPIEEEKTTRADLIVRLAGRLFFRDHGKFPVVADDLLGIYLKRIPPGFREEPREWLETERPDPPTLDSGDPRE